DVVARETIARGDHPPVVAIERGEPRLAHRYPDASLVARVDRDVSGVRLREPVLTGGVRTPGSAGEDGDAQLTANPHGAAGRDGDRVHGAGEERDFGRGDRGPLSSGP